MATDDDDDGVLTFYEGFERSEPVHPKGGWSAARRLTPESGIGLATTSSNTGLATDYAGCANKLA